MAKDSSFDIVSEFDKQELVNAVDQVKRDITSRFDLKNSKSDVVLDGEKSITITTEDDMKLRNIYDILQSKLVKRGLSIKNFRPSKDGRCLRWRCSPSLSFKKRLDSRTS